MDRSDVCSLIKKTYTYDTLGQAKATDTERQVFCNVSSVTQTEWFNGGQAGLKPEWKVTMFAPDYEGEEEVKLKGVAYRIYRTYVRDDELLELYLERRTGVFVTATTST